MRSMYRVLVERREMRLKDLYCIHLSGHMVMHLRIPWNSKKVVPINAKIHFLWFYKCMWFVAYIGFLFCFLWRCNPTCALASSFLRFLDHTHNDASQSVGLLWTSDKFVGETSTWQHTTLTTDKHQCPRWDSNPRSQQASGRRPTP